MSIRFKFLFFLLTSLLGFILIFSISYQYLLSIHFKKESITTIEKASQIFDNLIKIEQESLQKTAKNLLENQKIISSLNLFSNYGDYAKDKNIFEVETKSLEELFGELSLVFEFANIVALDKTGKIIAYKLDKNHNIENFLNKEEKANPFAFHTHVYKNNLEFEMHLEIKKESGKKVGTLIISKSFGKDYFNRIEKAMSILLALKTNQYCISPNSDICSEINMEFGSKNIPSISDSFAYIESKNHLCGVANSKNLVNSEISVIFAMPKHILQGQKEMLTKAAFTASALTFLLIPVFLLFAKIEILNPISALLKMVQSIKNNQKLKDKAELKGEFAILERSFFDMQNEIHDRENRFVEQNDKLNELLNDYFEFQKAANQSSLITKSDLKGNIIYANDKLCEFSGYSLDELLGKPHNIFRHPKIPKSVFENMWKTIKSARTWEGILLNQKKNGTEYYAKITIIPILDKNKNIKEFIGFREDVSELIKSKQELKNIYSTDTITGEGNRYKLLEDLQNLQTPNGLQNADTQSSNFSIAIINIDRFKDINDFYGQEIGDMVIFKFSKQIKSSIFDNIKLYRIHADEFAILNTQLNGDDFSKLILNICKEIEQKAIEIDDHKISISATAGVCFEKDNAINKAEMALKEAKKKKIDLQIYNNSLQEGQKYKTNLEWVSKIKTAIENDKIVPYFQPIYNIQTQKIDKFEALVRLIDENGVVHTPYSFLEIAKKTKYYHQITKIMIEKSAIFFKNLPYSYNVNLTMQDLSNKDIFDFLALKMEELKEKLTIELVESEGFESQQEVFEFMELAKQNNVKIAIDDFGTGYSNFEYLLKINADYIKIDGSLIKNIDKDKNASAVVEVIVSFAKKNNLKTVAEFVSSKEIYDKAVELGIDYAQGWFIGKPEETILPLPT